MMYATKRLIAWHRITAYTCNNWVDFTTFWVPKLLVIKEENSLIYNEFIGYRKELLILSGNKINYGDNAWDKILSAFKSLYKIIPAQTIKNNPEIKSINDYYKEGYDIGIVGKEQPADINLINGWKSGNALFNFYKNNIKT